jgi:hypothetical protein
MGHLFESAGLTNPNTALQSAGGSPSFIGSPSQVLSKANAGLPSADAMMGPDVLNPQQQAPKLPTIGKPSFIQAVMGGNQTSGGMPVSPLANPSLSKGGKLIQILGMAAQGALAGRAAQEQTIAASGGHRAGGVGTGFDAGYQLPFLRALQGQKVQQGSLENQEEQLKLDQQKTPVDVGGQSLPLWLATRNLALQDTQSQINQRNATAQHDRYVSNRNGVYDTQTKQVIPGTQNLESPDQQFFASQLSQGKTPEQAFTAMNAAKQQAKPTKPDSPEQQFLDEYQKQHQGASIADAQAAYRRNDPAFIATQNTRAVADQQRQDADNEKSYQYHTSRLDKLRQPVEQQLDRLSRLGDTLNQGTPQADALVAPELLTAMAGGQGSGLRMNESEISRIVGGRNQWQDIKAKLDAWQTDPNKGFSLTPTQRQQVRALLDARTGRLKQQQGILDQAGDDLVGATSSRDHRAIYNRTQKSLSTAMTSSGGGATSGKAVSLAAAKQLPAMKGKSDEEIRQAIQASGHQVIP